MVEDLATLILIAFVLSLLLTLAAERVAMAAGVVARPTADRWHRKAVPLLGGVPIVVATLGPLLLASHGERRVLVLALAALAMASVGLVDDLYRLSPQLKLLAQLLLGAALLNFGFVLRLTGSQLVDLLVTLFWMVGITNAFNLLDNMDGLSATIAALATGFRLLFFQWDGDVGGVHASVLFIGALLGFLVRNFPPAKIFMGDTGSLFLGFYLAGLSLLGAERSYSRGTAAVLVIPVLLLLIPIFDTAFVTITRLLAGRSPAVGGRDHTSHRLVAIGLREWQVLVVLALLAAANGAVAVLSYSIGLTYTVVLLALLVIGFLLLGVHLSRVHVVHSVRAETGTVLRLLADFQYKRQVATLALDVCLIATAYYAAYLIRFEQTFADNVGQLYASLPIVLLVQLAALFAFGLYRPIWEYTSLSDVIRIAKAVTVGTVLSVFVLVYTHRFVGFSRTVFILDALLLLVLLVGVRTSFRLFSELLRSRPSSFRRVLIYGAGDGGELIVREILNNRTLQRVPVGFIDDDRDKHQTRIHSLPVFGGTERLEAVVREHRIEELIISSSKIGGEVLERASGVCDRLNVPVRRASFHLE